MPQFIYFVPERSNVTIDKLHELGLGFAFDGPLIAKCEIMKPQEAFGGKSGTIVAQTDEGRFGFYPEHQEWYPMQDLGGVYFGWEKGKKPQPSDLIREDAIDGKGVVLGDGNEWHVPVARDYFIDDGKLATRCRLPCKIIRKDGHYFQSKQPLDKYRELMQVGEEYALHVAEKSTITPEHIDSAARCLMCNYRIHIDQILALELFDSRLGQVAEVLNALMDLETFHMMIASQIAETDVDEELKKKQSTDLELHSSGIGQREDQEVTLQQ